MGKRKEVTEQVTKHVKIESDGWNDYGMYLSYHIFVEIDKNKGKFDYKILGLDSNKSYVQYNFCEKESDEIENIDLFGVGELDLYYFCANHLEEDEFNALFTKLNDLNFKNTYKELIEKVNFNDREYVNGLFRYGTGEKFAKFKYNVGGDVELFNLFNKVTKDKYLLEKLADDTFTKNFINLLKDHSGARTFFIDFMRSSTSQIQKITNSKKPTKNDKNTWDGLRSIFDQLYTDDSIKSEYAKIYGDANIALLRSISKLEDALKINDEVELPALGQYTSNSTLQYVLPRTIDGDPQNFLRLTNGNQLNDPMEGKILLSFLKLHLDASDYKGTDNFLASLTSNTDELPMWQQYGDNARGICAVFSEDYIREVQKYLYHVCYIKIGVSEEAPFKISVPGLENYKVYKEDRKKHGENEPESIEEMLNDLISKTESALKESNDTFGEKEGLEDVTPNQFFHYFDKLAFLFKSYEYNYENEYRIIKAETNSIQKMVQPNDDKYMIYTYLKDLQISYSKILLGPNNTQNVNYLGEYIKMLSPETKISLSEINFR
ncbi:hypothetical protein JOC36_000619 [Weissella uvarum]|uniref:DUF2971 domain-containing protein n=1 Tax=Weissella uvarum TaxID=1479233 RepID=UPI001961AE13|nr:DUF2971 domain-containing protein [Weissella uvarum]MBM7617070.1 hypothetical protein [Weissella uvarum]MCM0595368.1 DUF2971 domain-containing protein [Weissella uvarum]